jgi:hypothetical protein
VTVTPPLMSKTRLWWLPLTASWSAPGPSMSRFLVMASSLVSVMVWPRRLSSKTIWSPSWAAAMAARREPSAAIACRGLVQPA